MNTDGMRFVVRRADDGEVLAASEDFSIAFYSYRSAHELGMRPELVIEVSARRCGCKRCEDWRLAVFVGRTFTYDGEPVDIEEFLEDNPPEDNPEVDVESIARLRPGQTIHYGGGAAPATVLRRIS